MTRRSVAIVAAFAIAVAEPRAATATSTVLVVQVGDAANGAFIAEAQVRLPALRRAERTRWNGEARFGGLANGRYHIQVRAIGYAPGDIDVLVMGDTLPVTFNLERINAALDTVRIVASRPARGLGEFEERRRTGIGHFLTDSTLTEHRAQGLRLLLATRIPGFTQKGGCQVLYYRDGFREERIDVDAVRVEELAGIEIYTLTTVPPQYRPRGDVCRIVLLWTKWDIAPEF